MTSDLIGTPLTASEERLLALYRETKSIAESDGLAPTTRANVLTALAALGVAVTSLGITFEHLIDSGA
jgi:hypothetical protein